jgi:Tfp pilus assembly protein PilN
MIKINLLPLEKRKAERTPLPRFMLILGAAITAAAAVLVNIIVYLQIMGVEREIRDNTETLERLAPRVQEHDNLQAQVAALKAKVDQIDSLSKREVHFWRAVSALWDVIQANPKVWIDSLRVLAASEATSELKRFDPTSNEGSPYAISLRCHVAGSEVSEMTKFREALKENPFLKEYLTRINFNVDWKLDSEKDYAETHSIAFDVSLLGPMEPPKKVKAGATAAAPQAPAAADPAAPASGNVAAPPQGEQPK